MSGVCEAVEVRCYGSALSRQRRDMRSVCEPWFPWRDGWRCIVGYWPGDPMYRAVDVLADGTIDYERYRIVTATPCGAWVVDASLYAPGDAKADYPAGWLRWTKRGGRWCSATKDEAREKLVHRTRSWMSKARRSLERANQRAQRLGMRTTARGALLNIKGAE